MDTYEKKYSEALEKARELRNGFEGYNANVAIIEQIFPELRESEDERIRKAIMSRFQERIRLSEEEFPVYTQEEVAEDRLFVAWLEKQKEEEGCEIIPIESTLEYKLGFKAGEESQKQKEQKPIMGDGIAAQTRPAYIFYNDTPEERQKAIDKFFPKTEQKPAEWSEEDDWKRKELIQYLEEKGDYRTVWMIWLKSLRPSWKPSEEQMNALFDTTNPYFLAGDGTRKILKSLYEQLQKLKGGVAPMREIDE